MLKKADKNANRLQRHKRVRRKITGTTQRPRLCVYRSNTNLYVQIIDDVAGKTLVSCSTLDKDIKEKHANIEAAKEVGTMIAKKAIEKARTICIFKISTRCFCSELLRTPQKVNF